MKKLLIVTTNFPPSASIGTQRVLRICKFLDPADWHISILTVKEKYNSGGKKLSRDGDEPYPGHLSVYRTARLDPLDWLLNMRQNLQKNRSSNGRSAEKPVHTIDVALAGGGRVGIWQRVKDYLTEIMHFPDKNITFLPLAFWRGLGIVRREKIDILFATAPPHSMLLIAALLKLFTRKRLVIDFRDPWARSPWLDEQRASNRFERWKAGMIQRFERWVVRLADCCVFVTPAMRDDFRQYYPGVPAGKFQLFYNGYDPDNLPVPQTSRANSGSKAAPTLFVHTGVLYRRRDPRPLMHAVRELLDEGRLRPGEVHFRFIGGITAELSMVPGLVDELALQEVFEFLPPVSYQESLDIMWNSDVLILLQPVTKLQIPGKFYDYICFEKPIFAVCEPGSAVEELIAGSFGISSDYNRVSALKEGILKMLEGNFDPERIRRNRLEFDMSRTIGRFAALLEAGGKENRPD